MATVAGYSAVLRGSVAMNKFLPMLTTAAGTIAPAKVFVIGAGVAGLQAIATARRLGGVVEAFDIRPVAKEQVESLGARFVEWEAEEAADLETEGGYAAEVSADEQEREQQLLAKHVAGADLVVTTAAVPGRSAPRLISADMVAAMRPGSVIVDLAAATGGNCELTVPGETVEREGVKILGALDLATTLPVHASEMYARTVSALLKHLAPDGDLTIDLEDEITAATCVTHMSDVRWGQ
jgi:NAD(P) transhydrogenase subunit alpha